MTTDNDRADPMKGLAEWLRMRAEFGCSSEEQAEWLRLMAAEVEASRPAPAQAGGTLFVRTEDRNYVATKDELAQGQREVVAPGAAPWPEFSILTDSAKCHISIRTDTPEGAQRISELIEELADADAQAPSEAAGAAQPVAWRYREQCEVMGQCVWGDWRHVGFKPQGEPSGSFQIEPLYDHPAALNREVEPRTVRMPLTKLDELAKVYATNYASPHHFTLSVEGLRNLIEAAKGESK